MKQIKVLSLTLLSLSASITGHANILDDLFSSPKRSKKVQRTSSESQHIINKRLNNDKRNSKLGKLVIIINEGDRTHANPEGQSLKVYKNIKRQRAVKTRDFFGFSNTEYIIENKTIVYGPYEISTGAQKFVEKTNGDRYFANTEHGYFRVKKAYNSYYSRAFWGSSMRKAVFFNGGIALHQTPYISKIGSRASGGCIRMKPKEIEKVNSLVLRTGSWLNPDQSLKIESNCKKDEETQEILCKDRTLYTNRKGVQNINKRNGSITSQTINGYDAIVVVKPGNYTGKKEVSYNYVDKDGNEKTQSRMIFNYEYE